jgi:histidinol-phosphate/aromatic aminotransferase/cobyric acid decarboxylase-like protein
MSNSTVADLFNVPSHNPSFFSVKESAVYQGPLLDFCIPVNLHFPPPQMVQRITERLPEILSYYPDYAEVHAKHIGEIAGVPPECIVPEQYGLMVRECSNKIGSSERYLRLEVQTREAVDLLVQAMSCELSR